MFFRASATSREEVHFRQLERPVVSGAVQVISKDGDCHGSNLTLPQSETKKSGAAFSAYLDGDSKTVQREWCS